MGPPPLRGVSGSRSRGPDLAAWHLFLENVDEGTAKLYRRGLKFFCIANGYRSLEEAAARCDERAFVRFLQYLKGRGVTANTVGNYVAGVKRFYDAVGKPLSPLKLRLAVPRRRPVKELRAVPRELVRDILLAATPFRRLPLWFLYATGTRIGEALSLRKRDFDLDADPPRVIVPTEKRGGKRVVFLPRDLADELRRHLATLRDEDFVFHRRGDPTHPTNPEKILVSFRAALRRLGLLRRDPSGRGYELSLHSFRRSYESILTAAGVHFAVVKLLLGHSLGVEESYLRLTEDEIAKEWAKAEPLLRLDLKEVRSIKDAADKIILHNEFVDYLQFEERILRLLRLAEEEGDEAQRKVLEAALIRVRARLADLRIALGEQEVRKIEEIFARFDRELQKRGPPHQSRRYT